MVFFVCIYIYIYGWTLNSKLCGSTYMQSFKNKYVPQHYMFFGGVNPHMQNCGHGRLVVKLCMEFWLCRKLVPLTHIVHESNVYKTCFSSMELFQLMGGADSGLVQLHFLSVLFSVFSVLCLPLVLWLFNWILAISWRHFSLHIISKQVFLQGKKGWNFLLLHLSDVILLCT